MKEIELTQGQVALVDDEDFDLVSRYKWHASYYTSNKSYYALTNIPHPRGGLRKDGYPRYYCLSMQRLILGLEIGDKRQGDHINHDTLDNRRSNLRVVTASQNSNNRKK